ncbi:hypothetical protein GJ688_07215 [Heliobacillus mobilis]|uniref:Histidine kinase/HSP90-like ATPase domain-containing protein n=1 Tax=Heliobacterium mobile TaxID=28064 RepID=A0A6I3SIP1_HELMO|nr:ATP-binding protein [Heliobacterium mobile]MTV48769.1 hypothetical protein [Heliobacterium mobile]
MEEVRVGLPEDFLTGGIQAALREQAAKRELLEWDGRYYDVHFLPVSTGLGSILALDVTDVLWKERHRHDYERKVYREVMYASTQGHLIVMNDDEKEQWMQEGSVIIQGTVKDPLDIRKMRLQAKAALKVQDRSTEALKRENMFLLCASEALTNAIKHAEGGEYWLREIPGKPRRIRFWVADSGDGIALEDLPKAALMNGYSTSDSLGSGFFIMLHWCNRVMIWSGAEGTVVGLEGEL